MSDKKAKYSTVKIIESTDARVIVQWCYALVDVVGTFAFEDPETGWGDWTNETFTIYPDMTGVRKDMLLSNAPNAAHEWQEGILVMGPGQSPETILNYEAVSLGNKEGETASYSWEHKTPPHFPPAPKNPITQIVNTKSEYRPFSVVRPQDNPKIDVYSGEIRRDVSVFPWWNHWPVAPRPTDGRYAQFSDRASHSSVSHWNWGAYEKTDRSMTKIMLNGLTNKKIEELLPMAKSWYNPAKISFNNGSITAVEYEPTRKAYSIKLDNAVDEISFIINANSDSPIVNPAFEIEGWGRNKTVLIVNGTEVKKGKDYRYGFVDRLDGIDMVTWVRYESEKETKITLKKIGSYDN